MKFLNSKHEIVGSYEIVMRSLDDESSDLYYFIDQYEKKKFKITVELIEDNEETITMFYRELFDRCTCDDVLVDLGVKAWYFSELNEPEGTIDIPKSIALRIIPEYEFEARKNKQ